MRHLLLLLLTATALFSEAQQINGLAKNNGVKPARQGTSGAEEELKRVQQSGGVIGSN